SRNFLCAGVLRAVSHLAPTGKYAPPRPLRPESLTSCQSLSEPIDCAFSNMRYGLGWYGSTRPTSSRTLDVCGFAHCVSLFVQVRPPSSLTAGACQQLPAQPTFVPSACSVSATARLHEPSWTSSP